MAKSTGSHCGGTTEGWLASTSLLGGGGEGEGGGGEGDGGGGEGEGGGGEGEGGGGEGEGGGGEGDGGLGGGGLGEGGGGDGGGGEGAGITSSVTVGPPPQSVTNVRPSFAFFIHCP